MRTTLSALGTAFLAAALALCGNYLLLALQSRARVKEERRAFVRQLHPETVALVVDVDLFVRSIRADLVAGARDEAVVHERVEQDWENDLLRRVRNVRFGHPDPDVREAAEALDDAMWPIIVMAQSPRERNHPILPGYSDEDRSAAFLELEETMVKLRRAVYAAPNRDVPTARYDGMDIPPRTYRHLRSDDGDAG